MSWVIGDCTRLTLTIRVDQADSYQVLVLHSARFRDRQRISLHGLDRPPDVDDLHTALQELVRLFWKMVRDAGERRFIGLVNVYAIHWTTKTECSSGFCRVGVGSRPTDSVVKDENSGCPSSKLPVSGYSMILQRLGIGLHILEQLLRLCIILCFDLLVIHEIFLNTLVLMKLKAVFVKRIVLLTAADVVDRYVVRINWAFVRLRSVNVSWGRR
jgi:hypothetical protein